MGTAVGGFPPPKLFAREASPEEVIEHVLDNSELEPLDGWQSEWGLRIDTPRSRRHLRSPETPT